MGFNIGRILTGKPNATSTEIRYAIGGKLLDLFIGAAIGAFVGFFVAQAVYFNSLIYEPPVSYTDGLQGFAFPRNLFELAREQEAMEVTFEPPELIDHVTCEFIKLAGEDWKQRVNDYLVQYDQCFVRRQTGPHSFSVEPNIQPWSQLVLDEASQRYFCQCRSDQIASVRSILMP